VYLVRLAIFWRDKRLTYFDAMKKFCDTRGKNFNVITVHMAEYKSLDELYSQINKSIYEEQTNKLRVKPSKNYQTLIKMSAVKFLRSPWAITIIGGLIVLYIGIKLGLLSSP